MSFNGSESFYSTVFATVSSQMTPNLAETLFRYKTDIEIIFNIIDKDHSGKSCPVGTELVVVGTLVYGQACI